MSIGTNVLFETFLENLPSPSPNRAGGGLGRLASILYAGGPCRFNKVVLLGSSVWANKDKPKRANGLRPKCDCHKLLIFGLFFTLP
jgi:hypothetical protein